MFSGRVPYKKLLESISDGVYFADENRKIIYWNKGAEQISGFTAKEMVGKNCHDGVLTHIDKDGNTMCTDMCPLVRAVQTGEKQVMEAYLQHKKGHRIPILLYTVPVEDDQGQRIGAVETFSDNSNRVTQEERIKRLENIARVDSLTNLPNRRHLDMLINSGIERTKRYNWQFGIIFMDIDNFKGVNDSYGHDAGDRTLKMVANNILNNSRAGDIGGRWGGEEFVIICDNIEISSLKDLAERYRLVIERSRIPMTPEDIKVTVSLGCAVVETGDTAESLLLRVDSLMYDSKRAGKNRVTCG